MAASANCCTSVLLPAFAFQSQNVAKITETCKLQFGVDNAADFELFALVPLTQATLDSQMSLAQAQKGGNNFEIGVRMNSPSFCNLTLRNVENSMLEKNRLQNLLKSSNEALLTFTTELKRIKKVIMAAVLTDESMDSTRIDSETAGGAGSIKVGASTSAGRAGGQAANNNNGASSNLTGPDQALASNQAGANQNMDALLKRLMKFKHLEDDNKKLKNLLK